MRLRRGGSSGDGEYAASSCAVLGDFIREKALAEIDSSILSRKAEERIEIGRLKRLAVQYTGKMEHREGQLAALRAQREAKRDEGKESEVDEREKDCETLIEEYGQVIKLVQQECEHREEVLEQLAAYEEKMKTVETIELALESTSAAAAAGGKGKGGGTVGQPIDLYADPLRVAAALIPPRSKVSVIGKPHTVTTDDEAKDSEAAAPPPGEPFSLILPLRVIDRDERVRTALRTCA
ncbi:hypothetical protein Pmar_PMAR028530 [Perkinsus marinus ATCC 50983]|uniref:Uncharacterized protein n=1 Tax=Perkinsus marinus (strain ATCC 50983 / TXsc) TaxID=423536 RepID=C5LMD9_PERM5|nr:hypothetical protein Pmar_PMAR028530 [Perkinsus marinus ATCC 50983]EER02151.1 hypothetical protein Pmar_PMAR028530 [Perkinsus marinus ATCC 50983]|eukprot:XP_002769433.1 hypothetical protein Pmar_PMAR028530 [Perkinsus marinus ATCC 50983]